MLIYNSQKGFPKPSSKGVGQHKPQRLSEFLVFENKLCIHVNSDWFFIGEHGTLTSLPSEICEILDNALKDPVQMSPLARAEQARRLKESKGE
jgi:hypothetical protein